jgi:diadenosine tetraphosphate (Ap4A) HIT family hydrolase
MNQAAFALDPQLAGDTVAVGDLALSRVLLNDDANYPWLILVPRRAGLVELTDLDNAGQDTLMDEVSQAARALKAVTGCDKLNVAALGNVVSQLHVHVIARFHGDAAWPNPVWGKAPRKAYEKAARDELIVQLWRALQIETAQG